MADRNVNVAPGVDALACKASRTFGGKIPLHDAAERDCLDELRALVETRADINVREDTFGWTALHVAAGKGNISAVKELVALRAQPNERSSDGETPLHLAAQEGQVNVIRKLVECRADVNCGNDDFETPLHTAVEHLGDKPVSHIQALLDLRADASKSDSDGHSVLDFVMLRGNTKRAEEVNTVLQGGIALKDSEDSWPESPQELSPGQDPIDVAEALRTLGNTRFQQQRYEDAIQVYFKAKRFLPSGTAQYAELVEGDTQGARARDCKVKICTNAALCQLNLKLYDECVNQCDGALLLDPKCVKAMFHKACALLKLEQTQEAEECLRLAASIDSTNASVQKTLASITQQKKRDKEKEKRLAQKMFG
eukprot:TRINITY_DN20252_c0_g1_i1.p1 TRINITY_DN20252_c0_g1~~TRINITY_DN20252_c0_g1_i1.p1  ORF type:complete len:367 (-),score=55.68 TRINITY_DN20252_c0_g1_i1:127-1227(-)